MIKSMTGFGKAEVSQTSKNIVCEIKTLNSRYLETTVRLPRKYNFLEEAIKNKVKEKIKRGKVEVYIFVDNLQDSDTKVVVDSKLAKRYYLELMELKKYIGLEESPGLEMIANMPDVVRQLPEVEDEEKIMEEILLPVTEALKNLDGMRRSEGEKLREDMEKRALTIESELSLIEKRAPLVSASYKEKLEARIGELLKDNISVQEDRILLEVAVFADRSNIDEEIVRLKSHMEQFRKLCSEEEESSGKKMDFLVQEMNREANTIGSKANDIEITGKVLLIKSEIEKIREQVQNIE